MFSIKASLILLVVAVFFVRISQVAKNNLCIFFRENQGTFQKIMVC